jgi:hypothetical protein
MVTDDQLAMALVAHHGNRAMVYVETQVDAAFEDDDWEGVKTWRRVGSQVEKLLRPQLSLPLVHHG